MRQVVMGMAGHVDHGKTALVKRLTNVDTDRLREEKLRGMTIDLGFAPLLLPDGRHLSIIDVPGHERFVKTMVAGVMGIDLVLLVVAADEGIMPQTREHLDIIGLLGVTRGVVALTKIDLVEEDWLDMVREEVRDFLHGTALAEAKVVPVSAKTGEGIGELMAGIATESDKASQGVADDVFRLPVDRVFMVEGHGTIVTGTVYGGLLERGAKVVTLPQNLEARVRGIQVHGKDVEKVTAGNRCALNLTGISCEDVRRGNTIAYPGQLESSLELDAVLASVRTASLIRHGQRVRVHLGTSEVMGRVRVIGGDEIAGGERGYVQIRTEEPVVALRGDRYIVRSYSPVTTIGGGQIIMVNAPHRRRSSIEDRRDMELEAESSTQEILQVVLRNRRRQLTRGDGILAPLDEEELSRAAHLPIVAVKEVLASRDWVDITGKHLLKEDYQAAGEAVVMALSESYIKAPFRLGVDKEELRNTLFREWGRKEYGVLLERLAQDGLIVAEGRWVSEPRVYHELLRADHPALLHLEAEILERNYQGYQPKSMENPIASPLEMTDIPDMIGLLIHSGKVVDVGYGLVIHRSIFDQALEALKQHLAGHNQITVGQFRDILQTNRKVAVALLECFDGLNITKRQGDERISGPRLEVS
ncbi:MAG: selenocysteine-specific translation elongation factor [Firmicutes bacterium]|nr:selenocysteine-specific translation elongation factor [Bacillota bacterium]